MTEIEEAKARLRADLAMAVFVDNPPVGVCTVYYDDLRAVLDRLESLSTPAPDEPVERRDCLPPGHRVIEQADMLDGRVSQTVHVGPEPEGEEYERIVHADEAYHNEAAPSAISEARDE
jgi:hypothetical protein